MKGWSILGLPALGWCRAVAVRPCGVIYVFALSSRMVAGFVANDNGGAAA